MRSILLLLTLLVTQSVRWNPNADIISTNGKIVTVDSNFTIAQALAIRGSNTKVLDLAGKTVIPGLQDSHIHFLGLGEAVIYETDLSYAKNAQDIVRAISDLKQKRTLRP